MKFGNALTHQLRSINVSTDQFGGQRIRFLLVEQIHYRALRSFAKRWLGDRLLEIMFESLERIFPRIALVCDKSLQDREIARFGTPGLIFHPSHQLRRIPVVCALRKETSDFDIWINSRLEFSEELHDELVAKYDRGIALFCLERVRFHSHQRDVDLARFSRGNGGHFTRAALDSAAAADHGKHRASEIRTEAGVVKHACSLAAVAIRICSADLGDHQPGPSRTYFRCVLAHRYRKRQDVGFGLGIQVFDIEEGKMARTLAIFKWNQLLDFGGS